MYYLRSKRSFTIEVKSNRMKQVKEKERDESGNPEKNEQGI